MRSLASLLEGAVRRAAFEVRLESGQPVVYTTARGTEAEPSVLPRTELFDMIVAAVDDAQQIELAVGNPVEFTLDAGTRWSVSAEPGQDGITVRAQRPGQPAAPAFHDDVGGSGGFHLEEPQFDVSGRSASPTRLSSSSSSSSSSSVSSGRARPPSAAPPSELYVEALDVPAVDESGTAEFAPISAAPPFDSGTWTLDDEDEVDVGLDSLNHPDHEDEPDEDSLPTGFAKIGLADPHIGVPDDDDDADSDPFADVSAPPPDPTSERRHTLSPTIKAMQASSAAAKPSAGKPAVELSQRITLREIGPVRTGDGATQRELASIDIAGPGLIADVAEGTLVYVLEPGLADVIARSSQAPVITIDDPHHPTEVWTRVRELPPGAIVVVRCEDPSTLLDGILRRLEEGYRVFVETPARTVEGARRILLGISATDRAERWLDAQLTFIVEPSEGGPRLLPAGKG
jgi:hypothetical protein